MKMWRVKTMKNKKKKKKHLRSGDDIIIKKKKDGIKIYEQKIKKI